MVVNRKLDNLWSLKIRLRDLHCVVCGSTNGLQAHHIISRGKKNTRYDLDNGVTLCPNCHTGSPELSAHKTPQKFKDFLKSRFGESFMIQLEYKSNLINKWQLDEIK